MFVARHGSWRNAGTDEIELVSPRIVFDRSEEAVCIRKAKVPDWSTSPSEHDYTFKLNAEECGRIVDAMIQALETPGGASYLAELEKRIPEFRRVIATCVKPFDVPYPEE